MLENPWVSLTISIDNEELTMKLVNGISSAKNTSSEKGIGISNVRKRLELLYPQRHELRINRTEDAFVVNLKLRLEKSSISITALPKANLIYE